MKSAQSKIKKTENIINTTKREVSKQNINLTATNRYIDIGNRRLVKDVDAIDKYEHDVNKGQLDKILQNNHYSILQFVGKIDDSVDDNLLSFSFNGLHLVVFPINVEMWNSTLI
jgi:hypothetical protein